VRRTSHPGAIAARHVSRIRDTRSANIEFTVRAAKGHPMQEHRSGQQHRQHAHDDVDRARDAARQRDRERDAVEDAIDEAIDESFPASDPPSSTPVQGTGAPDRAPRTPRESEIEDDTHEG
jgi:hypothetical protein